MKVLVTGSAGFIGSALSIRLLARGDEVIGIDCLNDYYDVALKEARLARTIDHPGFTECRVKLEDRDAIADIFAKHKPQRVVNLAAQAGVRYSIENGREAHEAGLGSFDQVVQNLVGHRLMKCAFFTERPHVELECFELNTKFVWHIFNQ